jgi:hypothetical protein
MLHLDLDKLSERARPMVEALLRKKVEALQLAVSRKIALGMLDIGLSKLLLLEASGELQSFIEGGQRKILVSSIYDYLIANVIKSYPVDGPAPKRQVRTRFRKARRKPTEAELAALDRANQARHEDKLRRLERRLEGGGENRI